MTTIIIIMCFGSSVFFTGLMRSVAASGEITIDVKCNNDVNQLAAWGCTQHIHKSD